LLSADCSIDRIENLHLKDCEDYFEAISSISNGDSIDISDTNCSALLLLCNWLSNSELETQLVNVAIGPDVLSLSNVIDRLILKSTHKCDISNELKLVSLSLNELSLDSLRRLDSTLFESIVSSAFLRIDSEDFLLNLLCSLGHFELLGYVECIFLSVSGIDALLNYLSLSSLNCVVWDSLCRRLRCKIDFSNVDVNRGHFCGLFRFTDQPFCGILSHVTSVCGGNVHEREIVEMTCSLSSRSDCWRVADHSWTDYWYSNNEANSWICFNFKSRHLQLQHYTLKSSKSGCYFTDWVIEGSNDGSVWIVLDVRHTDDRQANR
jgi:hypothetical protein